MANGIRLGLSSARQWRTPVVLAASLALHAALLGLLATRIIIPGEAEPFSLPPLFIEIEPRPLLRDEQPRPPTPSSAQPELAVTRPTTAATPSAIAPRANLAEEDEEGPATATAPASRPDIAGVPARTPPGLGRSLRTSPIGCNTPGLVLSPAEQARCDQALDTALASGAPIRGTGNPDRDGRFAAQGRREMEAYEGRRRPLSGGTGVTGVGDCPGSNFGIGCPGAHLDRGWRRDNNDEMTGAQGGRAR